MTLAGLERRLAAMHQNRTFNPNLPFFAVFTAAELEDLFRKPEEASQ